MMSRLLAKKLSADCSEEDAPYSCLLSGHIEQVADTAELLIEMVSSKIAKRFRQPVALFRDTVMLAALGHDLGKIGSLFQPMVRGEHVKQFVRHEVLSVWLLKHHSQLSSEIDKRLSRYAERERYLSFAAVCLAIWGHHFKWEISKVCSSVDIPAVQFPCDHPDLADIARLFQSFLGISIPQLKPISLSLKRNDIESDIVQPIMEWLIEVEKELTHDEQVWIASVRSILITADMIGSLQSESRTVWESRLDTFKNALAQVNASAVLDEILAKSDRQFDLNPEITEFQARVRQAAFESDVVLVESGCGTGKTRAAFGWGAQTGAKYMMAAYPTTATVTQGYIDHLTLFGEYAQMLHSRREVDLDLLLESQWDENIREDEVQGLTLLQKQEAMERLIHPVTFCTIDSVLGLLHNYRSSHLLFPVMLDGCVVVDEAHSLDDKLWQGVLQFLRLIRVPVLIMTASLQTHRRDELARLCCDESLRLRVVRGPEAVESIPKYAVQVRDTSETLVGEVIEQMKQGYSTLVVLNTVDRAIDAYEKLVELAPDHLELLLYHSHFKYEDRISRQAEIVDRLRNPSMSGVGVVCTQICEMSFDISVGRLFSEIPPFPSAIQRLGRLLRYLREGLGLSDASEPNAMFWLPETHFPYANLEMLLASKELLKALPFPCSQSSLYHLLLQEQGTSQTYPIGEWLSISRFLSDSSARESQHANVEILLRSDWEQMNRNGGRVSRKDVLKKVLPLSRGKMPKNLREIGKWHHVRVIGDEWVHYDKEKGGRWK